MGFVVTADIDSLSDGVRMSLTSLAREFCYARETIKSRLDKGGVRPDGQRRGNPVFRLRDCITALTQQSDGEIEDPRALPPMERRAWYASEKDRLITEEKESQLVSIEDHRDSLAFVIQGTVQLLETLPDVLERDCGLDPSQINKLEEAIDAERERWAMFIESEERLAS